MKQFSTDLRKISSHFLFLRKKVQHQTAEIFWLQKVGEEFYAALHNMPSITIFKTSSSYRFFFIIIFVYFIKSMDIGLTTGVLSNGDLGHIQVVYKKKNLIHMPLIFCVCIEPFFTIHTICPNLQINTSGVYHVSPICTQTKFSCLTFCNPIR